MQNKSFIVSAIVILALAGVGFYVFNSQKTKTEVPVVPIGDYSGVTNFRDCVDAGYPASQSLPRQCNIPDGRVMVEGVDNPTTAKATGGCYIGGCSSEVCSDQPDAVSNCMYESKFICYQTAVCERQTGGACGWRQSPDVISCLESAIQSK